MRERIACATLALLASALVFAPSTAHAGLQLFTAEWYTETQGNECQGTMTPGGLPGPHCPYSFGEFATYSNWAIPQGILCNPLAPRCPFQSTPTDGMGNFHPLGGFGNPTMATSINCAALSTYNGGVGGTVRPAKGQTASYRVPPLYRNSYFFTPGGQPNVNACAATSTGFTTQNRTRFGANKGKVQLGAPVAGTWNASATGTGGFLIPPAPPVGQHQYGIRTTGQVGSFTNTYPYIYSYTYAKLRNDIGFFGPGQGPGNFNIKYTDVGGTVASINVKQGLAKFGGTMKMLGALTTKVCYWLQAGGGCSLTSPNWRYEAIGASVYTTNGGAVTQGYQVYWPPHIYCTPFSTFPSCYHHLSVSGARFPWTTGSVTVTAVGRGPHKTVHYAHGYDNRNTTTSLGKGTIQLVSPTLTRWFGFVDFETGGIGILRIKFVPEPHTWVTLLAGVLLLGVGYRMRRR